MRLLRSRKKEYKSVQDEYRDQISRLDPDRGNSTQRVIRVPWLWEELEIKSILKMIPKILGFLFGIYILHYLFGWWFLGGLIPAIPWTIVLWFLSDRENYLLFEDRVQGDIIQDENGETYKRVESSEFNIWKIPPEWWQKYKKIGDVWEASHRIYICDYFDPENDKRIFFAPKREISNMRRRKETVFLKLKEIIPKLEYRMVILEDLLSISADERAIRILERIKVLRDHYDRPKKRVVRRVIDE